MINKQGNIVNVHCVFKDTPTLAMFVEAAAQASSSFETINEIEPKMGFLATLKDVKLINDKKMRDKIKKKFEVDENSDIPVHEKFVKDEHFRNLKKKK